jgi:Fur family ferric uptake transcriptional regulator
LRVTQPRIAVLSVIHEVPHRDVDTITRIVRERIGAVSTQTVYGNLNVLVEARLARRIDLPGSPALYEGQTWDDHQHAVCRGCGGITDVDGSPDGVRITTTAVDGFAVDGVDITFWGVCPDCQSDGRRLDPKPAQTEIHNDKGVKSV